MTKGLGMAIYIRPVDTRPGLTLMGRILPGLINYRVGYVFFFKITEVGLGRVRDLQKPGPNPDPDPTQPVYIYKS